jgi:multisubunit Na+/H+ antiporter MnhE subunit
MVPAQFFRIFWLVYLALMAMLGAAISVAAGWLFAHREMESAVTATMMTALCGLLCGAADDSRHSLPGAH